MSDKPEGPDWWIASDGKWYPPELHPSVKGDTPPVTQERRATPPTDGASSPKRWQGQADRRVGPQFPDLFQKAMQGSHLADTVSVKYDGADERNGRSAPSREVGIGHQARQRATGGRRGHWRHHRGARQASGGGSLADASLQGPAAGSCCRAPPAKRGTQSAGLNLFRPPVSKERQGSSSG